MRSRRSVLPSVCRPLPIPAPVHRRPQPHRQPHDGINLPPVVLPAPVLAPRAFLGVADQIRPGDMVMTPDFSPANAGEEALGAVGVDAAGQGVGLLVVPMTDKEREWAEKARRFIKAELKRAGMTYADLATKLNEHGLEGETEASVNSKLVRGTFSATWLLAVLAVLGITALVLADL